MLDAYEHIRTGAGIRRLEIGGFLFAQFTCTATDGRAAAGGDSSLR